MERKFIGHMDSESVHKLFAECNLDADDRKLPRKGRTTIIAFPNGNSLFVTKKAPGFFLIERNA
jgi:hypothetical protein